VDAGLVVLGEQHAAVDDEQVAVVLEHRHVAAHLAEPAQRDHAQAVGGQGRWGSEARLGGAHAAKPSTPPSARSRTSWATCSGVASGSGSRTGPAGRPRWASAAFVRIAPWVRNRPTNTGSRAWWRARARSTSPARYASTMARIRGVATCVAT